MRCGLSSSKLKWIALVTMLIDHLGAVFGIMPWKWIGLEATFWTSVPRWIGRMAFPIFAFLLARGCDRTRSLPRYAGRLALFALISQIPYTFALSGTNFLRLTTADDVPLQLLDLNRLNIFPTLLLGLAAIACWKKGRERWWWRLSVIPVLWLSTLNCVNYGIMGVLLIFCLWLFPSGPGTFFTVAAFGVARQMVAWDQVPRMAFTSWRVFYGTLKRVLPILSHPEVITGYMPLLFICLSAVCMLCYDGTRGRMKKWSAYIFYPAHLLVLGLLRELAIALNLFS